MPSCIVSETVANTNVGMGQIAVGRNSGRLTAVLGSCVGLVLWHQRLKLASLAHIVLPQSNGRDGQPGKFADLAIPAAIEQLERQGGARGGLIAKITGGACMFGAGGPMQIGDANITAVIEALGKAGVPLLGKEVGGNAGRRVSVDCSDGRVTIESVGQPSRNL